MLVTLMRDPVISLTLPGKVQTYMAAGKPILAAADGETMFVVKHASCGYAVGAEDYLGLAAAAEKFAEENVQKEMGKNARAYFEQHYQRKVFFDRLESTLQENC